MLKVDLGRLAREHRIRIDEDVAADDPLWNGLAVTFQGPVTLRLDVQQVVADVVVRGRLEAIAVLACRRCLKPVRRELDEELTFIYRSGLGATEAEAEEAYPLPARGQELDLTRAVREHVVLAVPQYVICAEACRGLCARCGTNLNESSCDCVVEEEDPRWAALKRLRTE
jgi:uncharacterized protein